MTRPILWALGITAAAAVWGIGLASRFDQGTVPVRAKLPAQGPMAMNAGEPMAVRSAALESGSNAITLNADDRGHFATEVTVGGRALRMLVDTGASVCAFSYEDAERIGIRVYDRDFNRPIETANGTTMAARVTVPVLRIGTISLRDVEAIVLPRGRSSTSLLGMSFLRRLTDFKMSSGRLTLRG